MPKVLAELNESRESVGTVKSLEWGGLGLPAPPFPGAL